MGRLRNSQTMGQRGKAIHKGVGQETQGQRGRPPYWSVRSGICYEVPTPGEGPLFTCEESAAITRHPRPRDSNFARYKSLAADAAHATARRGPPRSLSPPLPLLARYNNGGYFPELGLDVVPGISDSDIPIPTKNLLCILPLYPQRTSR
ncbi:hypothetical protein EVAR_43726_1 [Eumeta japonica]|uniref:Uncharacterized protein n=1 Tax=Eumeta variegata TaxID=151549 RepID=A0A4C1Y0S4_EUMVA|nr:hypothetical protein EVAR_43726_1 [Eumeta japonica]